MLKIKILWHTLPIRLRILWRGVRRRFGDTYEMALDDMNDQALILKISLGMMLAPSLKGMLAAMEEMEHKS